MPNVAMINQDKVAEATSWQYYENYNDENRTCSCKKNKERREQAAKWLLDEAAQRQQYDANGYLKSHRICTCGNTLYGKSAAEIKRVGEHVKEKSLRYCETVSVCPVCSGLILRERAKEIDEGMGYLINSGGSALMLTLTISHTMRDSLERLLNLLKASWSGLIRDKMHGLEIDMGVIGRIKRLEVTIGENGFHPHLHVLLPVPRKVSEEEAKAFEDAVYEIWECEVTRRGGKVNRSHGVDVSVARNLEAVGSYISKELTSQGDTKTNSETITPFQLLDDDTPRNRRLFIEFVKAMKGVHILGWTPGLKDALGIANKTDKQILKSIDEEEPGEETIAKIEARLYNKARRDIGAMEAVKASIAEKDYYFAAAVLGCSWYMTPIFENGQQTLVPYFYIKEDYGGSRSVNHGDDS